MSLMRYCFLALLLAIVSLPASARVLPASVRFGVVKSVAPNQIKIADTVFRTAPGLRIFNRNNALIFMRHLPTDTQVGYQLDGRGELFQIWILTQQEIAVHHLDHSSLFSFGD